MRRLSPARHLKVLGANKRASGLFKGSAWFCEFVLRKRRAQFEESQNSRISKGSVFPLRQTSDLLTPDFLSASPSRAPSPLPSLVVEDTSVLKRRVMLRVVFARIESIQTIHMEYNATVIITAKWREPSLDRRRSATSRQDFDVAAAGSLADTQSGVAWNPGIDVQNIRGDVKTFKMRDVRYEGLKAFVVETRRLKGTFTEKMRLEDFPFDIQYLSVLVTSELNESEVELVEDETELSFVNTHAFGCEQEWQIHNCVYTLPRPPPLTELANLFQSKPGLMFQCCAARRSGFFVWNILFLMCLISALSLVTFAVHVSMPQNRIQLAFILVLAAVSFKFVASQSVPKISYPTCLDRYILCVMTYQFLVALWHGFMALFDPEKGYYQMDPDTHFYTDRLAFLSFAGMYLLILFYFILYSKIKRFLKQKKVLRFEEEYIAKAQELAFRGGINLSILKQANRRNTVVSRRLRSRRAGAFLA